MPNFFTKWRRYYWGLAMGMMIGHAKDIPWWVFLIVVVVFFVDESLYDSEERKHKQEDKDVNH